MIAPAASRSYSADLALLSLFFAASLLLPMDSLATRPLSSAHEPEETCRRALAAHLSQQGVKADFIPSIERYPGFLRLRLRQTHWGIPVRGGELQCIASPGNVSISGAVLKINPGRRPQELGRKELTSIAPLKGLRVASIGEAEVLSELRASPRLVRKYTVVRSSPLAWSSMLIDTATGQPVRLVPGWSLTGQGSIYHYDPLDGPPELVPFPRLLSPTRLEGENLSVISMVDSGSATGMDGTFQYEEGDARLEQTMAYYWIDRSYQLYLDELPMPKGTERFWAHTEVSDFNGRPISDNAAFIGPADLAEKGEYRPTFIFSLASRRNPSALSADVIIHEFNHYITDRITHLLDTNETTALHEGISDFFAVLETGRPQIARYYMSSRGGTFLRDLSAPGKSATFPLPAELQDAHILGEIYAQALWQLLIRLQEVSPDSPSEGSIIARDLVHQSRFYLSMGTRDVREGYEALRKAEQQLYGGLYRAVLDAALTSKGFVTRDAHPSQGTELHLTMAADPKTPDRLVFSPAGISSLEQPVRFAWHLAETPKDADFRLEGGLSSTAALVSQSPGAYRIEAVALDNKDSLHRGSFSFSINSGADSSDDESAAGCGMVTLKKHPSQPISQAGDSLHGATIAVVLFLAIRLRKRTSAKLSQG